MAGLESGIGVRGVEAGGLGSGELRSRVRAGGVGVGGGLITEIRIRIFTVDVKKHIIYDIYI